MFNITFYESRSNPYNSSHCPKGFSGILIWLESIGPAFKITHLSPHLDCQTGQFGQWCHWQCGQFHILDGQWAMMPHSQSGNMFGFPPLALLINVHSMRGGLLEIKWCLVSIIKWIYNCSGPTMESMAWIHLCFVQPTFLKTQICPLVFPLLAAGYLSKSPHVRPYLPNFEAMLVERGLRRVGQAGQPWPKQGLVSPCS